MDNEMTVSDWEPIDEFRSLAEFNRFVVWMGQQVAAGFSMEMPVAQPYLGATTFEEKWFRFSTTGAIWRLVFPDPPFTGLFELVSR